MACYRKECALCSLSLYLELLVHGMRVYTRDCVPVCSASVCVVGNILCDPCLSSTSLSPYSIMYE